MPPDQSTRGRQCPTALVLTGFAICCGGVSGCGLPTWNQLIGNTPEQQQPVAVQPVPAPRPVPTPPRPPEPPPKPKPEEVIARFRELKPHQIDDRALASLMALDEGLDAITELDLKGSPVTPEVFRGIGKLAAITRLDLRTTAIGKESGDAIGQLVFLEELRVPGNRFDDDSIRALDPLANLQVFEAQGIRLTGVGWTHLFNHRRLRDVELRESTFDDQAAEAVAELPELQRLTLAMTKITDDGVAALGRLSNLEYLDLWGCRITGKGFATVNKSKGLPALRTLVLSQTQLNEQGAAAIRQMKQVENLWLGHLATMQDQHLAGMIRGMDQLKELHLDHCPLLTSNALLAIRGHRSLEVLNLAECPRIDDAVFNHLVTCKNLRQVSVRGTNISAVSAQRFQQLLPGCEVRGLDGV